MDRATRPPRYRATWNSQKHFIAWGSSCDRFKLLPLPPSCPSRLLRPPSPRSAIIRRGFDAFIADFKKDAAAKGLSQRTLAHLNGVTLDQSVLAADKRQGVFKQSFEEFAPAAHQLALRQGVAPDAGARADPAQDRGAASACPGSMAIALWGLETDFGTNTGKHEVLRATATLGFDCRRTEMFQNELVEALTLVERGDLQPRRPARRLGRRTRPGALPAVVLQQVRDRLRRQRQARPDPQRAGHARLDRQLPEGLRLAGQAALERRHRRTSK